MNQEEKSNKKEKTIKIIVGVIAFAIAYFGVQQLFKKDFELRSLAKEFNKQTPMQVDQFTRLDSVSTNGETNVIYHYTLVDIKKPEVNLDTVNKYIRPNIIENVKNSPELKIYRDNKITMVYKYSDKNGNFVTEISVTPKIYNNK